MALPSAPHSPDDNNVKQGAADTYPMILQLLADKQSFITHSSMFTLLQIFANILCFTTKVSIKYFGQSKLGGFLLLF